MSDNKDYITSDGQGGSIGISEDVIASIASLAAAEVPGVAGFVAPGVDFNELLGKKNLSRGVKVLLDGDCVTVALYMRVRFGVKIPTLATEVQKSVENAIASMAGMKVLAVNLHIVGLELPRKDNTQNRK